MLLQVLVLSFGFGMILLPAVLCIIGPLPPNPPVVSYSAAKPVEGTATIPPQKASAALAIEGESSAPVVGGSAAAYESPVLKKVD